MTTPNQDRPYIEAARKMAMESQHSIAECEAMLDSAGGDERLVRLAIMAGTSVHTMLTLADAVAGANDAFGRLGASMEEFKHDK